MGPRGRLPPVDAPYATALGTASSASVPAPISLQKSILPPHRLTRLRIPAGHNVRHARRPFKISGSIPFPSSRVHAELAAVVADLHLDPGGLGVLEGIPEQFPRDAIDFVLDE